MSRIIDAIQFAALAIALAWLYATGNADMRDGLLLTILIGGIAWCCWRVARQVVLVGRVRERRRV